MPTPTNVLLITTDQQRTDSLGCYGSRFIQTPAIDSIADRGILFENAYVNNPICTPSRASLYTGKPLPGHGVFQLHDLMPKDEIFFTKLLQEAGYETALFGKLHVGGRSFELEHRHQGDGFDLYEQSISAHNAAATFNAYANWLSQCHPQYYEELMHKGRSITNVPEEVHYSTWSANRAIDFFRNRDKGRPFFCHMSLIDPHDPYNDYPHSALSGLTLEEIPGPRGNNQSVHALPAPVVREHEHSYLGSVHSLSGTQIMEMRKGYYASVVFADRQIGRVLEALEACGYREDTAILFTSDHGDMLGDHGLLAKGCYFFDECTRVPLLIHAPGQARGTRAQGLVQIHDIAATILHLCGVPREKIAKQMPQAMNLLDSNAKRSYAVCSYRGTGISDAKTYFDPPAYGTMYRVGQYKLNLYHMCRHWGEPCGELYDMQADPLEERNLWDDPEYGHVRYQLLLGLMDWFVENEVLLLGGRGGSMFPPKAQWLTLNVL